APSTFKPTIERQRVPRRPPLVEISEDLEVDISAYVGKDRRQLPEPAPIDMTAATAPHAPQAEAATTRSENDQDHRAPWVTTQPLERSEVAPQRVAESDDPPPMDPIEQHTAE